MPVYTEVPETSALTRATLLATLLAMAEKAEKMPIEAPAPSADEPSFASNEIEVDDADRALAAMGYKPVSRAQSHFRCMDGGRMRAIV